MKLGIQRRILGIIILILALSMISIIVNIVFIFKVGDISQQLYDHPFTVSTNVLLADKQIVAMHRSMKDVPLAENDAELEEAINSVEEYENEVFKNFIIIKKQILGEEGLTLALTAERLFIDWKPIREQVLNYNRSGDVGAAAEITKNAGAQHVLKLDQAMKNMLDYAKKKADGFIQNSQTQIKQIVFISIFIAVISIIINFSIGFLFAKSITKPIIESTQNQNSTSAEILASIQQQAANTKEQAASLQQTTTTMSEISQSGKQMTQKAKDVAQGAEATSSAVVVGIEAVEKMNITMSLIRDQVELVAENIVNLSEKTIAISDITATVTDIAEQSNLLALNASIEAVGAGEHGLRFAVVANEIKNLADLSKNSTRQVSDILEEIQKGINSSVMLTEEAVKRAELGKETSDIAQSTIKQLSKTIEESIRAFQQIVGSNNQQQIGLEQVSLALNNINTATDQNAIGISQIEKAVSILNNLSSNLKRIVHEV